MGLCADPRAIGRLPIEDNEVCLVDKDMRPIAVAVRYDGWWGICSLRSRVPISRRAESEYEALRILHCTVWSLGNPADFDEYADHDAASRAGSLYIRSLTDDQVLEAARDDKSASWRQIRDWMGSATNPSWITVRCAEEAWGRDLIDDQELDWISR